MGKRGPAPKPTALRLIHGSTLPLNRNEPKPGCGIRRPTWLTGEGRRIWDRLVPLLKPLGLATVIDANPLARYCDGLAKWIKAKAFLDEHGDTYVVRDETGTIKYIAQFPQVSIYRNLSLHLTRLEQEFGLTPSARTRIAVANAPEANDDPLESFLQRKPKIG